MTRGGVAEKKRINITMSSELLDILDLIMDNTNFDRSNFIEIAVIEQIQKVDLTLEYNGINFKDYAEAIKFQKLRIYQKKIRRELKSRHLFIERVKTDIVTYISLKRNIKEIFELLEQYKKEARLYKTSSALEEINEIIEEGKKNNFLNIFEEYKQRIGINNFIKKINYNKENVKNYNNRG